MFKLFKRRKRIDFTEEELKLQQEEEYRKRIFEEKKILKRISKIWPKAIDEEISSFLNKTKKSKIKIRDYFKYESRMKFDQKYLNAIEQFGLSPSFLEAFGAYPFGGFIRDIYHGIIPKDLDILFYDLYHYEFFARVLEEQGWKLQSVEQFREFTDAYQTFLQNDLTRAIKTINGKEFQIDLMFSGKLLNSKKLDFYANSFALDLTTNQFFFWNTESPNYPFHTIAFNYLDQKKNYLNPDYETGSPFQNSNLDKFRYDRVNKKIYQLAKNGWEFSYGSLIVRLKTNDLARFIDDCWSESTKQFYITRLLTSEKDNVRQEAKFFLDQKINNIPASLFANFLKSHYEDIRIAVKELENK